jgi:hypothetical protein
MERHLVTQTVRNEDSSASAAKRLAVVALIGLVLAITAAGGRGRAKHGYLPAERSVASQPFPRHPRLRDEDDILEQYRDYLVFVVSAARGSQPSEARSLMEQFQKLEKESPTNAARFLKGLKLELDQKVELMSVSPSRLSSSHPQMRPWIAKYLPVWLREVDEARFRAYTDKLIAKRRKSD